MYGSTARRTATSTVNQRILATAALAIAAYAALGMTHGAGADQPPLRVGFVSTFSRPFTEQGEAVKAAIAAFIKEHGDTVAGRKLDVVIRDDGGLSPENAQRLAQELIVSDHVDFLMGSIYAPNEKALGAVSTAAKKPAFFVNGGYGILEGNPYTARFAFAQGQLIDPLADWALKNNLKNVYMLYLNFGPGIDSAASFKTAFTAGGGKIVGDEGVPVDTTDFSASIQHIREIKPQAVFIFLINQGTPFIKQWHSSGSAQSGIKLLAGIETNELALPALGDDALGIYSAANYTVAHGSKLNAEFKRDMRAADPAIPSPDFYDVATYDALQAIYKVTAAQNGVLDPDRTMALVKALKYESPRGPIEIDPQTRDLIQNIDIRRVDKVDGVLQNTPIATYPHVRDPLEK
jgi:branched-chain amino acid transport system substrate-binding protein